MRLSDYLEPELVLVGLTAGGPEEAIDAMVRRLQETGTIDDPERVRQAVLEREASQPTALGNGVALPHATLPDIDRARVLVAVSPDGVRFRDNGRGASPERLFFLILSPLDQAGTHIKLLARIVRLVRRPDFVDALVDAGSAESLIDAITREDALFP
jgi:mannitol/fructose-specific phosphotransferase system IIA component (Ntr-type)